METFKRGVSQTNDEGLQEGRQGQLRGLRHAVQRRRRAISRSKHSSVIALVLAAALATGFSAEGAVDTAPTVSLLNTQLGFVLVTSRGDTLYLFAADRNGKSACDASCAKVWRPLLIHGKPTGGAGITTTLLGSTKRSNGSLQVTYRAHPLYTYARDTAAGQTTGEAASAFGARWYVVSAQGTAVHATAATAATTPLTTSTIATTTTSPVATTTTVPAPPAVVTGRYCGFTDNGSSICFTVTADGKFWTSGHFGIVNASCDPGAAHFDVTYDTTGQTAIGADLSFNFTALTGDAAGTVISGTLTNSGQSQGQLHVVDAFAYDGTNYSCVLNTTWTALIQR